MGAIFGLVRPLPAAEFNGSLSGDLYSWSAGNEDHLRPYLSLRGTLMAWRSAQNQTLSFHTYSRWMTDWRDKTTLDPQYFVYDAYLKLRGLPTRSTIYAGRQFVYSAVGSALIDGLRLNYGIADDFQIDIFGGSRVNQLDPEKVASLSDYAVAGAQFSYQFRPRTRFGLSWMRRMSEGYVSYHRLGLDVSQSLNDTRLYGRLSANPENRRLSEILLRAYHTLRLWYFSGEFRWRDPSVAYNSVFSLIAFDRYRESRFEVRRTIKSGLALFGTFRVSFFETENAWAGNFGLRTRYFTLAWVHQSGYGGDSDGLTGSVNYLFRQNWLIFGRANVSQYRVQEEQVDRSEAYSTGVGLMRRFGRDLQVRGEWQYLRNAVQEYDSRFLFRITKGFSFK